MPATIVVLDADTFDKNDLDWTALHALGQVVRHPRSEAAQIVPRLAEADAVLFINLALGAEVLGALPRLRYVGILATGTNAVNLAAARAGGLTVTNVPGYGSASVAQHAWAMILALAGGLREHDAAARDGNWARFGHSRMTAAPIIELAGKTLGIVGLGAIGRRVAEVGVGLGMRIAAAQQRRMDDALIAGAPVHWLPLDQLLAEADVISLHCPLTAQTQGMIDAPRLARMKPQAILINTARGPLIDEAALAAALRDGRLGGAGLDVFCQEPPPADHPLLTAPRCLLSPHVAWASREARQRLFAQGVANLAAWQRGQPINVVS